MHGCGARAFRGSPRNRTRQSVVNFEDTRAVTVLLQLTPNAGDNRSPAIRSNWRGVTSHRVTSYLPIAARLSMRVDVCRAPPRLARYPHSALVMDCAPPRGMGHPTACAVAPSITPKEALSGSSSARIECAASPAKSALVFAL